MGDLLHRALSESSLLAAWQEVQANDLEDGKVSEQVAQYARGVLARLTDLGRELKAGNVFEVALSTKKDVQRLRGALRRCMDREEDQIRLYPLPVPVLNEPVILGNRRLEERADFWIL